MRGLVLLRILQAPRLTSANHMPSVHETALYTSGLHVAQDDFAIFSVAHVLGMLNGRISNILANLVIHTTF
jgi:hypothetical protein